MKKFFILSIISLAFSTVQAQFTYDYLKAADEYFKKSDYSSAAEYYEKYLGKSKVKIRQDAFDPYTVQSLSKQQRAEVSNKQQAVYKLAESYRLLNYHVKAEPYYKEAAGFDKKQFPLTAYWLAKSLRALEKYSEADSALTAFLNDYTEKDSYSADASRELANLKFIQSQLNKKDLKLFTTAKASVSGEGATYAPVWMNNNTLLFTSTKSETGAAKNKAHTNRIYKTTFSEGAAATAEKINIPQGDMHQGVVSITPDGNTIFLTRWTIANGKKTSAIYSSKKNGDGWDEPVLLGAEVNEAEHNAQQPFVMPDGKNLLFASDRTGTLGGFDLWTVALNNGNVSGAPANLGAAVNTASDEQAPYYHAASSSLVFSSNGRVGMGGFDFYQSKGNIGNWAEPQNLGYPLNSVKDDIYFVSKGGAKNILGDVLFSTDRSSACCLELYSLQKIRPLKKISGSVVSCDGNTPVQGATVTVMDANNKPFITRSTGADGTYSFMMDDFMILKVTGSADGYIEKSINVDMPGNDEDESQLLPGICLTKPVVIIEPPVEVPDTLTALDIYFEFNRAVILPESYKYIDSLVLPNLQKFTKMKMEIGGHTDAVGKDDYNMELSQARANAVRDYLISKGIAAERLTAVGYGETKPVEPNKIGKKDNPEGRKKNRRTEFKVISY